MAFNRVNTLRRMTCRQALFARYTPLSAAGKQACAALSGALFTENMLIIHRR